MPAPFKPLVVGAPRSGFALLASVLIHFVPLAPPKLVLRQRVLPRDPLAVEGEAPWLPGLLDEADDSGRGGVEAVDLFGAS